MRFVRCCQPFCSDVRHLYRGLLKSKPQKQPRLREVQLFSIMGNHQSRKEGKLSKFDSIIRERNYLDFRLLHFNDVYEIESRDHCHPGAATFAHRLKKFRAKNSITLFSGDCLSPSELSATTKGEHMVDVLNELRVDAAVFGNHEFDYGIESLQNKIEKMKFPWLCSNVIDSRTGRIVAATKTITGQRTGVTKLILNRKDKFGRRIKIGIMGLIEPDWLQTLNQEVVQHFQYMDYIETANRLVKEFKEEGVNMIIALTHMREQHDIRVAREVEGIDLILGGHDHHYMYTVESDVPIIKSGSQFREFSVIDVHIDKHGKVAVQTNRQKINADAEQDKTMVKIVDLYTEELRQDRFKTIIELKVPIETRFARIRTQETNIGSFTADKMRDLTGCDVALLNSGTFRADRKFVTDVLTVGDVNTIFPMLDRIVKMTMPGRCLVRALENSVSQYPSTAGRFFQVSGVSFSFDPTTEPRIQNVSIQNEPIDLSKIYTVATKAYIANGNDGYDVFNSEEVTRQLCSTDEELTELPILKYVMMDTFKQMTNQGQCLMPTNQGRIINLEKFARPATSRSNISSISEYNIQQVL